MKEKKINVNGLNIAYLEYYENETEIPLIFLHGWLDNAASFNQLIPHLKPRHSLILDLPGHGLSDHIAPYAYYHFIDGISQVIALLDALSIDKVILVGHSLGGCLASMIAGSIPQRIHQLILLDALGPISAKACDSGIHYQNYIKQLQNIGKKSLRTYTSIAQACQVRGQNGYLKAELVRDIVNRGMSSHDKGYRWRHDPRLMLSSPLKMTQSQVVSFLKEVTAPTLLLNALKGFSFNPDLMKERIDAVKNIKVKNINCGHHLHIELPQVCAKYINDFLK